MGGIIGSAVSAGFLLVLGIANAYILLLLIKQLRKVICQYTSAQEHDAQVVTTFRIEGGGVFFRIFKKLFVLIDRYAVRFFLTILEYG